MHVGQSPTIGDHTQMLRYCSYCSHIYGDGTMTFNYVYFISSCSVIQCLKDLFILRYDLILSMSVIGSTAHHLASFPLW